jgi:GMP synthase-like glutamine amidotransferase
MLTSGIALAVIVLFAARGLDPVLNLFYWFSGLAVTAIVFVEILVSIAVIAYFRRTGEDRRLWHTLVAPALAAVGLLIGLYLLISRFGLLAGTVAEGADPTTDAFSLSTTGGSSWPCRSWPSSWARWSGSPGTRVRTTRRCATSSHDRPPARMRVLFVQQDHVSDPGPVGEAFAERGYEVEQLLVVPADRFSRPDVSVAFPEPVGYDAIVPLGAPWSVYDDQAIGSWIGDELAFLRAATPQAFPCSASASAGRRSRRRTADTCTARPSASSAGCGRDRRPRARGGRSLVPVARGPMEPRRPARSRIARTAAAPQAFVLRRNLAVQFHPELTPSQLAGWLDNGGTAYLTARGLDADGLYDATVRGAGAAAERSRRLVRRFLDQVAARPVGVGSSA